MCSGKSLAKPAADLLLGNGTHTLKIHTAGEFRLENVHSIWMRLVKTRYHKLIKTKHDNTLHNLVICIWFIHPLLLIPIFNIENIF